MMLVRYEVMMGAHRVLLIKKSFEIVTKDDSSPSSMMLLLSDGKSSRELTFKILHPSLREAGNQLQFCLITCTVEMALTNMTVFAKTMKILDLYAATDFTGLYNTNVIEASKSIIICYRIIVLVYILLIISIYFSPFGIMCGVGQIFLAIYCIKFTFKTYL